MRLHYWKRDWVCPYYIWDDAKRLGCEGGVLRFPSKRTACRFFERFCDSIDGYQHCSIAENLENFYKTEGEEKDAERGQDQDP